MSVDVTNNSRYLIGQDQGTNLETLLDGINEIIQRLLVSPAQVVATQINVETATGAFLDQIGLRVDEPRVSIARDEVIYFGFEGNGIGFDQVPFLADGTDPQVPIADDLYRKYLIARGGQLTTDGSVPSMNSVVESAFGEGHYIDNQDMSMLVRIDEDLRDDEVQTIVDTGLLTKPAGVKITALVITHDSGSFGFDNNGLGFDQAPFAKYVEV